MLYDLETDPRQLKPVSDGAVEKDLCDAIRDEMTLHDAPMELYARFDLTA